MEGLRECQCVFNAAVHETIGVQPHYAFYSRHAPRLISVKLPQIDEDTDKNIANEVIHQTNLEMSRKWREEANVKSKNLKMAEN